ncbi:sce7726 family protein [Euzebya sp.]|uniref:sce7726 family protein n=1 Tax=Euzebya sp. TaxID=1971409 RepID=UPI003515061E
MTRLSDPPIRAALHSRLDEQLSDGDRVVFEMPVCGGTARLDAARLNGHLEGYEIKSDRDTLARLDGQVQAYGRVVDRMTIVCTPRHLDQAMDVVPPWWGVWEATGDGVHVDLAEVRSATENPDQESVWVAQLLWRDECLSLLDLAGVTGVRSKPRRVLWRRLADVYDLPELSPLVTGVLKNRRGWLAVR